ncbi:MAG: SpoIVB peptidase [Clostridia bacterium]|nr:SpoIVB peptidase [Clostridia bacterium]
MIKAVRTIKYILSAITLCFLLLLVYSFYTVPDEIYSVSDEDIRVNDFYTITYEESEIAGISRSSEAGRYKVRISLFNAIPVKDSSLTVSERQYVTLSGEIIGLRLFTDGVMIVGIDSIETENGSVSPGQSAGLETGDVICSINGITTESSSKVNELISGSEGKVLEIEYVRNGEHRKTEFTPVFSLNEQKYKGGLWVRDSAAGIGTMTFYDNDTGAFAALGHAVCDVDTGEVLPLSNGDIVSAGITGCTKGTNGRAGELCGVFTGNSIGVLFKNSDCGIFGVLNGCDSNTSEVPVATEHEIEKGPAQIVSTVDENGAQYYDIEITKISTDDSEHKNMVIKVTDEELLEKTGGIVQGMSGSPIVQNGKLVGAVTHVLVNDPTKGYGIFIENMLEAA